MALYSINDVERLNVSRKEREGGFTGIEDTPIQRLEDYIKKKCRDGLMTEIRNSSDDTSINRTKITRKQKWEEKQIYTHFKRKTSEIQLEKTWTWLKRGIVQEV